MAEIEITGKTLTIEEVNAVAHDRATVVEMRQRAIFPDSRVQVTSHLEPRSHDHPDDAPHDAVTDSLAS